MWTIRRGTQYLYHHSKGFWAIGDNPEKGGYSMRILQTHFAWPTSGDAKWIFWNGTHNVIDHSMKVLGM